MTDEQLTSLEQTMAGLAAEWPVLGRIDWYVAELCQALDLIRADTTVVQADAAQRALAAWYALDELGVDLNVPNLKTLLVAHAARYPTSDGTEPVDTLSIGLEPVPSEPTSGEAVTAQTTPVEPPLPDTAADTDPASPDLTRSEP